MSECAEAIREDSLPFYSNWILEKLLAYELELSLSLSLSLSLLRTFSIRPLPFPFPHLVSISLLAPDACQRTCLSCVAA